MVIILISALLSRVTSKLLPVAAKQQHLRGKEMEDRQGSPTLIRS